MTHRAKQVIIFGPLEKFHNRFNLGCHMSDLDAWYLEWDALQQCYQLSDQWHIKLKSQWVLQDVAHPSPSIWELVCCLPVAFIDYPDRLLLLVLLALLFSIHWLMACKHHWGLPQHLVFAYTIIDCRTWSTHLKWVFIYLMWYKTDGNMCMYRTYNVLILYL